MKKNIFDEAGKIWQKLSVGILDNNHQVDHKEYQPLLNFFMAGDFYYYVFNVQKASFDFVSPEIINMLGYTAEQVTVPFFIDKIHPDDQPWFLNFENKVEQFFKMLNKDQIPHYKVRYDYRVRKKNGEYIRILQQVITLHYEHGKVLRTFGVHTDISHLKINGNPVLSFIGLNGEPSYHDTKVDQLFSTRMAGVTKREYEILHLIAKGKNSEDISKICFISKQTVNTHRKNLLKKTGCINAAELTSLAVKKGWITALTGLCMAL